ncbi:Guanylate kinase, partial [Dissostichus eleginoides]
DCSPEEKIPSNAKDHQPPSEPLFTHHTPAGIGPKKKSPLPQPIFAQFSPAGPEAVFIVAFLASVLRDVRTDG